MDVCTAVKPILALVTSPTSTVVKATASLLSLTLRPALDSKATFTFSEQVLTDLQVLCFIATRNFNPELILSRSLCSP